MEGKAEKKVEKGKLLKILVKFDKKLTDVKIMGDFFLHPEEKIVQLEKCLKGIDISSKEGTIEQILRDTVKKHEIKMLGVGEKDIAETVVEALKNGQ